MKPGFEKTNAIADRLNHTTLSRRSQWLDVACTACRRKTGASHRRQHRASVVGEGEWAAAKHGGRGTRGWKKLHLGVDRSGVIVAHALTEATVDDATVGIDLSGAAVGDVASVTGDAAYDTVAFYEAASARHAQVVVPPTRTAKMSRRGPRSSARDRAIAAVETLGRRQWKKASGYHRQARVENAFFRYKSIIGAGLRARSRGGREVEASLACRVLNRMTELGRPESSAIVGDEALVGGLRVQVEPCTNADVRCDGERPGSRHRAGTPAALDPVDHGTEFMSRALEAWAHARGVAPTSSAPANPSRTAISSRSTAGSGTIFSTSTSLPV